MARRALALVCALLLELSAAPPAEPIERLRVCADPDNLPFSRERGPERGLYVELAELVAARLGATVQYFWWRSYFGKRTVRSTLLSDECDAYFGLPYDRTFMSQSVALTRPFLDMGYAVIAPRRPGLSAVDDLRGRRVAVQFSSSPQLLLSERGGYELVTFREPEDALEALARREVDAAFVWGPVAGYFNKQRLGGAYQVSPVAGPGLQWQAAVGVRKREESLRAAIEGELDRLAPDIARLAAKYGFPSGPPIGLARVSRSLVPLLAADSPAAAAPPDNVRAGRSLFNQYCSHCHAPNALSPEPSRDLRRLRARYGDKMRDITVTTMKEGRPTKGMPTWGDVLNADAIGKILTFLESVQN
ncbi:MAG TPA: transporter substrate-binding domain-containing protein [Methylomirabilota bacterium]|jgi:ABC-type amino acid transport substrate-binding protein